MADKQTTESTIKMTLEFTDGTEQSLSQINPSTTNLANKINTFATFAKNNNIFISSKSNAGLNRIKQALKRTKTETDLDLS